MAHKLLDLWLSGTTCSHWLVGPKQRRELVWEDEVYILLKHNGHTEYIDRMTGSKRCGTYVALYRKADCTDKQRFTIGDGYMRKWEGRFSRAGFAEAMAACRLDRSCIPATNPDTLLQLFNRGVR